MVLTAKYSYWVLAYKPSTARIVVSKPVVVQSRLRIKVLSLKPQILFECFLCKWLHPLHLHSIAYLHRLLCRRMFNASRRTPGFVVGGPDDVAHAVGQLSWRPQVVRVDIIDMALQRLE